jgi:Flp pilus assembly pilin Flp
MPEMLYRVLADRTVATAMVEHGLLAGLIAVAIVITLTVIRNHHALILARFVRH